VILPILITSSEHPGYEQHEVILPILITSSEHPGYEQHEVILPKPCNLHPRP
jgi:hypothetical protein